MTAPSLASVASVADLPSLDRVLRTPQLQGLASQYGHTLVVSHLRQHLDGLRGQALAGRLPLDALSVDTVAGHVASTLAKQAQPSLRPVFNLTGTVLHTNLGRALLPDDAIQALGTILASPVNLEFDLDSGKRGERDSHVEGLICELTGAEAATVVNNNAAAVLLLLNTLASNREVVVSRGELVEIGGSFRIPDIMQRAGARLVEIGTTNRTHLPDYEQAIGPDTAMLLKVHCSNYEVVGFSKSVALADIAKLASRHGLPACVDLGSGTLIDLTRWGLPAETTVQDSLAAGADVVTFSGDKLLGGPQAGFLAGSGSLINQVRRNPLKRALRVGKITLAVLQSVLGLYRSPELLSSTLPTLRLLTRDLHEIQQQAARLVPVVQKAMGQHFCVQGSAMLSQIGSGSLPVNVLPSFGLLISPQPPARAGSRLGRLQAWLRELPRPVIGRIADDALWLDLRCLELVHEASFIQQLEAVSQPGAAGSLQAAMV